MTVLAVLTLVAVVVLSGPLVAHALILNTAPLSTDTTGGTVRCVVSNTSAKAGDVTVQIFSHTGSGLVGGFSTNLVSNATSQTDTVDLSAEDMGYCRCIVPNKKFLCSLVYVNGTSLMVIHGQ